MYDMKENIIGWVIGVALFLAIVWGIIGAMLVYKHFVPDIVYAEHTHEFIEHEHKPVVYAHEPTIAPEAEEVPVVEQAWGGVKEWFNSERSPAKNNQ